MMQKNSKIYIAGHTGLVGSALMRTLTAQGYTNLIFKDFKELDLRNQNAVNHFFAQERPDYVFLAAAKVGGIHANATYPAQFIYDNLMIECNVINAAYTYDVEKLLFLGSSCIYPRECPQPIKEEYLMSGALEKTNEPYAMAKIAGIQLSSSYNREYGTNFMSCMPTNLYGPHDTFDLQNSHVIPALIAKIYQAYEENAPTVTIWGTGTPRREFLFVDDLADACLFLMNHYQSNKHINIGVGNDISITELAQLISSIIGYTGTLIYDTSKPDGTPRKVLDVSAIKHLGWQATTSLHDGLQKTIDWYTKQRSLYKNSTQSAQLQP